MLIENIVLGRWNDFFEKIKEKKTEENIVLWLDSQAHLIFSLLKPIIRLETSLVKKD